MDELVRPVAAGRLLVADDDRAGAPAVAVISFALSQSRCGSAEAAPGQTIRINNVPFTVAGVAPPEFFGVNPADGFLTCTSPCRPAFCW